MPKIKRFTTSAIRSLKLPDGRPQIDYFENLIAGRSLILTLNKSGKKSWSVLFYENGTPRRRKFAGGEYPAMSCKDARNAAINFDTGKALASARAGTLRQVAESYLKRHVVANKLRSEHEVRRLLKSNVYPHWGKRRFADIKRRDVAALLDYLQDNNGATVASSTLAIIRALMNWQQTRDDEYSSPIVPKMLPHRATKRQRWLGDNEIRELWLVSIEASTFGAICRVLLLTGQRREKVRSMQWTDVDLQSGIWRIRREPREKGAPKAITLPQMALEIIRTQQPRAENPFIFAGRGKAAFNAWSQSKRRLDAKLGFKEPWRLHDLRRTSRKLMTRAGIQTEVAELALGHSIKGIQGVYDDPDEYRPEIDKALRRIELEIMKIFEPEQTVVAFPR